MNRLMEKLRFWLRDAWKHANEILDRWPIIGMLTRAVFLSVLASVTTALSIVSVLRLPELLEVSPVRGVLQRIATTVGPQSSAEVLLNKGSAGIYVGVAAFGGVVIVSVVKELVASVEDYVKFATDGGGIRQVLKPLMLTFVTVFALTMSLSATREAVASTPSVHLQFVNAGLPYSVSPDASLTFFVVFLDEAGSNATKNAKHASVSPDPLFQQPLRQLVHDLAACIEDKTDVVEFVVRGFASSSEWTSIEKDVDAKWIQENLSALKGTRGAQSTPESFNLWIADRRALNIQEILAEARESVDVDKRDRLLISTEPQSLSEIRTRSVVTELDKNGKFSKERAILTRRGDVLVRRVGNCMRPGNNGVTTALLARDGK